MTYLVKKAKIIISFFKKKYTGPFYIPQSAQELTV